MVVVIKKAPEAKEFTIPYEGEEIIVGVRQATEGDAIQRADIFAPQERVMEDDDLGKITIKTTFNRRALNEAEAYFTLAYVRNIVDEDGIELFRSKNGSNGERVSNAMSRNAFSEAWGALPSDLAAEITSRIYKVNADWDPNL